MASFASNQSGNEDRAAQRLAPMSINCLSHFVAVATAKDFDSAARSCQVPVDQLQRSIVELENYLDAPVVERGSITIRLTRHGEEALLWAKKILCNYEAMRRDLSLTRVPNPQPRF
jgi:DNA-binding transcriptional LysR family regulator